MSEPNPSKKESSQKRLKSSHSKKKIKQTKKSISEQSPHHKNPSSSHKNKVYDSGADQSDIQDDLNELIKEVDKFEKNNIL